MEKEFEFGKTLVFSYLTLRKVIGFLGVVLPFALIFGALIFFKTGIQSSISSYYHTGMRDVFVGTLWAIGFFLLSYQGYGRRDNIAGNLACLFAVGVSLFPTDFDPALTSTWIGRLHLMFAAAFFFTLMYFSLFLFTKTDPTKIPTPEKLQRNRVYKTCGYILAACILFIGLYAFVPDKGLFPLTAFNPVFWLETIAILAFGVSWLTKGEAILKDDFSSSSDPALSPGNA